MPRPRYETSDKTARERLDEAFWACLAEKPYGKITVADIAERASVNRNTFYYYFEDMNDLARTAARETALDPESVTLILTQALRGAGSEVLERIPDIEQRAERICLLAGKHSNAELQQMLRDAFIDVWSKTFEVDFEALDLAGRLAIEFVLGGIIAVIAYRADNGLDFSLHALYDFGLNRDAMNFLRHIPPIHEKLAKAVAEESERPANRP